MTHRILILLTFVLSSAFPARGQTLEDKREFILEMGAAYSEWISASGFHPVLAYDSTSILENQVKINLTLADSLNFTRLDSAVHEGTGFSLPDILLRRATFLMDLNRNQIVIVLKTDSHTGFLTYISQDTSGEDAWTENLMFVPGQGGSDQIITLPLSDIRGLRDECGSVMVMGNSNRGREEISSMNRLVLDGLKKYFSKWKTQHTQMEAQDDGAGEAILLVRHLKGAVEANGYYEKVRIDMKLEQKAGALQVLYQVQELRAAAGASKPYDTDYRAYSSSSKDAVDVFEKKLKMEINRLLRG